MTEQKDPGRSVRSVGKTRSPRPDLRRRRRSSVDVESRPAEGGGGGGRGDG